MYKLDVLQEHMLAAYQACAAECGKGCFVRMKHTMEQHVAAMKGRMFIRASGASSLLPLQDACKFVALLHMLCLSTCPYREHRCRSILP